MNSSQWLTYYQNNKLNRPEPKWNLPSPLDRETQDILARSLSHFQLGETGEGRFLLVEAPDDTAYQGALQLFVDEEKEHARLLERLVVRFGGKTIARHWSHTLFHLVRHAIGFKFEIQLLVIAELVGTAYYRLLYARTRDPVLEETCGLILKDEARHVDFHADGLGRFQSRMLPLERAAWSIQFQILFAAAARVAWFDHGAALRRLGASRREFFGEARRECIRFLRDLDQIAAEKVNQFAARPALS